MKKSKYQRQMAQSIAFVIFVVSAGIAIFSDNGLFETLALVSAIVFATLEVIEMTE